MNYDSFAPPDNAQADAAELSPIQSGSAFSQGLRGGMEDIAGQTHALLGQGGELAGAMEFAADQRAKSLANQQQAERLTANIPTFSQVDGLRSGFNYATGLLGRSLPALGAGVAGAALMPGKGALAGIAGMTAATAPSTIGSQFEAQQNDPEQAKQDVTKRTLAGVGAGTAQAAAMSVVPQLIGGKLFARAAEGAAAKEAMPFAQAAAHNVPEAVLGNAAAGNVSTQVGQQAASYLNPDRDTSNDAAEQNDAAIGGAVMGAPFAALGIAGAMRGKKAGAPVEPMVRGTDAERASGMPITPDATPPAPTTFSDKVADLGSPLKADPITGEDHTGALSLNDTPETVAVKDAQGNTDATAKAQRTTDKLLNDPTAAPFHEALSQLDPTTSDGQMQISDINAQHFEAKQNEANVKAGNAALDALSDDQAFPDVHFSKDASGAEAGIYKMMDSPEFNYLSDGAKQDAASMVRKFISVGEQSGDAPITAVRALTGVMGDQAVSKLSAIYDSVGSSDPAKRQSFFKALSKVSDVQKGDDSLLTVVRNALPPEMIDTVRTSQIKEFVAQMKDLTGERMFKDMPPSEQVIKKQQINAKLQEVFGENADKVNEAFAKHAKGEADLVGTTPSDRTDAMRTDEGVDTAYYGGGKDGKSMIQSKGAAQAEFGAGETAHERIMKKAQLENPNADVSWVSAKDYAKENNIGPEQLDTMTKGRPDDHGMVKVQQLPDPDAFGKKDLDAMRLEGKGKTSHYESRSRINTGTPDAPGPILDAMRVASHMMGKMGESSVDDQGNMHKLARAFKEGIAAASDHIDESIHVPDETVVARRGGKDVTWGELQKVQNDTAKGEAESDPASISKLKRELNKLEVKQAKFEQFGVDPEIRRKQHAGEPLTHEEFSSIAGARKEWERLDKQRSKIEGDIAYIEKQGDVQKISDDTGKTDLSSEENIHVARAGMDETPFSGKGLPEPLKAAEKEVMRRVGVDGQSLNKDVGAKNVVPKGHLNEGSVTDQGRKAIGSRISSYEAIKSESARAIGKKARDLLNRFDDLTKTHQAELAKIIKYEKPSSASDIINDLHDKYSGKVMTKAEYRAEPAQQKWANTTANEGGDQHKANLAGIARRTDPRGLQQMLDVLNTDKKPNEFKQGLIDAANKRIGDIIQKDPEKAYGLLTKGNEAPEAIGAAEAKTAALDKMILNEDFKLETPEKTLQFLKDARERYSELKEADTTPAETKVLTWVMEQFRNEHSDLASWMRETPGFFKLPEAEQTKWEKQAEALHEKRGENASFSREKTDDTKGSTKEQQKAAVDHVNKVTGGSVDVNATAKMIYAGSYLEGGADHRPAINVSIHALDPLSVAYHESLHWLADDLRKNGDPKMFAALTKVGDSPYVRNFLRNALKDQPEALKQVLSSAEERVAYMYQFHANGMLKLGERGKTILDHIGDYLKKVMGVWSNDERAQHIMDYFHSGEYAKGMGDGSGDRSAVYKQMMEQGRNKTLDYLHKAGEPLINLMDSVAGIGSARIQDMNIPALSKMADMVRLHGTKEGSDTGFLPASGIAMRTFSNKLVSRMGEFSFEDANKAFAAISLGKAPSDAAMARHMSGIRDTLTEMHGYLKDAGVNVGDRGLGKNYTPRQWDSAYVAGHQTEFKAMIQKYIDSGEFKGTANDLMSRLMRDEGSEMESADAKARPGDQHVKKRELSFITAEDAAPFMEKNAMRVLTSYIRQGTRRAEWSRRFEMKADGKETTPMEDLRAAAVKQGATPEQMKVIDKYLSSVTGQLGSDVRPETRKLFGQVMVYQNLRLLPMGFFSSLIDPVGVGVRGGNMRDVFNNFKRGITEIPRGFQKNPKYDEGYHFAEDMGVIDNAVLQHVMGASYGLNAVGNKARMVNETLFKWNLMEQMNTSQRVAASEAAMGFLKKHGNGDFNEHSMRYLGELGLRPADVKLLDGRVAARTSDFTALGMKPEAAEAAHLKMAHAINSWVDGAVLRPDQSQKAIWMNDAHFSLIAHMKQFAFSFQDTILKRVLNEAKYGNYSPAVSLAGYIPVMLAADLTKGLIQGGGAQPAWKQDWGLDDYLSSAWQRAGLNGVGQFGVDAFKDLHRGGIGLGALGGPTLGQLGEVASTVGGSRGFAATMIDSMPANALWSGYLPNGVTHPNAGGGTKVASSGFAPTELNTVD